MPIPKQVRKTAAEQLMRALVESYWVNGKLLLTSKACEYIFEYARINGLTEVKEATSIFKATRDGWTAVDFHRLCDNRGPTLCLVQSEQDFISAGFTSIAWESYVHDEYLRPTFDASACVFALTGTLQVFKPKNPERAVGHHRLAGPYWYNVLVLYMDGQDGYSDTKGSFYDYGQYEVVRLPDGKNPLTGSTDDRFTCVELEVFALQ